ncbi:murein transglycosylase A [Rhodocyclus purpureus]|uniref:murein transglycosylase A n=1 Tax=Rhodocyclus purpureus TaxID=1067 RepID=UPI001F5D6912|nr:murein transglycosylase A [Rhodocyclus purpureus]
MNKAQFGAMPAAPAPRTLRRRAPAALLTAFACLLLSACAGLRPATTEPAAAGCAPCPVCPVCPAPPPPPAKPLQAASWADLPGWADEDIGAAWPGFLASCRALAARPQWPLWRPACDEAKTLDPRDRAALRAFFESRFAPYLLTNPDGGTNALVTGYYEPLLRGARQPGRRHPYPLLAPPDDLLTIDLGDVVPEVKGLRLRGRLVGKRVVPYYSRAEIVSREQEYRERALFWVDDPIELFFLQIQGSGRIRLPDGGMVRVGYADQNGHPYQSIGRVLIERGHLSADQASMQGIQAWARSNPDKLNELLNSNPSYVFFRELNTSVREGPPGALGVPLVPGRSIAVDPRFTPLGAPVFLATTQPNSSEPLKRLVLAQDTGGAIRGPARADFFWGFGAEAGAQAGRMKQGGQMWVLLPPGLAPKQ